MKGGLSVTNVSNHTPGHQLISIEFLYRFAGGMRSHRNSLVRRPLVDDEAFTLTAQAIKLPSQSHQTRANPQLLPPVQKPTPQGILKSSSVGTPAHVRIYTWGNSGKGCTVNIQ